MIEKIRNHYQNNINNRFVRKALLMMKVPRGTWDQIARLTEKSDLYKIQGYPYNELYEQIHAAATFVHQARIDVLPRLRSLLAGGTEPILGRQKPDQGQDPVLLQMAIENFPANLGLLADQLNELYLLAVELDKAEHLDKKPVYERMPELKELGRLLI
ncbi:MAG: hypothetical protein JW820_00550 [Spirochaetales bacterium]|nr:hypothetical protein [Spirochaetales bacterium]